MGSSSERFENLISAIDAANAEDPRRDQVGDTMRPREVVYAERMTDCLLQVYPGASEVLQIAARAQHIRRWEISRSDYPQGRAGYNAWRAACRDHHALATSRLMASHGYSENEVSCVASLLRKESLKTNTESQALEDVVGVVFVRYYLEKFIADHADYSEEKFSGILRKTFRKMSAEGRAAVAALELPPAVGPVVAACLT